MPALERLERSVDIAAPASKVYQVLVGSGSYTAWTQKALCKIGAVASTIAAPASALRSSLDASTRTCA